MISFTVMPKVPALATAFATADLQAAQGPSRRTRGDCCEDQLSESWAPEGQLTIQWKKEKEYSLNFT